MKKIKCLFCKENIAGFKKLKEHYLNINTVGKDNILLTKYLISIKKPNKKKLEICGICSKILEGSRNKANHLLKNHNKLLSESIKNLPIIPKTDTVKDHKVYTAKIYRSDHFYEYDWDNSDLIESFLNTAKLSIDSMRVIENNSERISVNVNFDIVNKNISKVIPLYLPVRSWSSKTYTSNSIDETTIFSLNQEIRLKVIQNGESSSSVVFSHFTNMEMVVACVPPNDC